MERTIPGKPDNTIEAISWAGTRLFTVGLSGDGLKEWDIKTMIPKRQMLLTGEKGICMDYNKATETLAVGTEEGIINIFDVSDDDLQYVRVLDRQDHRIICCKFNDAGDKLVSGSLDAVKIWNIQTGQVIHKMSTGRADPNQETIVWCVDILNDFTVVSGDSRGKVIFWDGSMGTQIDYVHASQADIMCLSVSEDRKSFFCSGVEQILRKYTLVKISRAGSEVDQWVRCVKKSKIHTHDVLSMVTIGNEQMISGGVDGFLSFASQDLKHFEKAGPFLQRPFAEVAEKSRLMLLKYVNYLEVWKLADAKELIDERDNEKDNADQLFNEGDDVLKAIVETKKANKLYRINEFPEKFLELRSKNDEMIVSCAISSDGHWIAYSTMSSIRLFRFEVIENEKPKMKLIKTAPEEFAPCTNLIFSMDSSTLITVNNEGQCSVFALDSEEIVHKESFNISEHHSDLVHLVAVSSCSKYLVMASLCNNVTVWNLKRNKWTHASTLPKYSCPVTSMNISSNQPVLILSFSDNKLLEYNLDGFFIQFAAKLQPKSSIVDSAVTNTCSDPRNPDAIIFSRNNAIHVLEKNSEEVSSKKSKTVKKLSTNFNVKVVKTYNTVSQTIYDFVKSIFKSKALF